MVTSVACACQIEAWVREAAEAFNAPLAAINAEVHDGVLPPRQSFLSASPENAMVTVLKQAEDGEDLIVRCVETHGQDVEATIRIPHISAMWSFPLGHAEIKSFRVGRDGSVHEIDLLEDDIR